jgi:hypothetical protein
MTEEKAPKDWTHQEALDRCDRMNERLDTMIERCNRMNERLDKNGKDLEEIRVSLYQLKLQEENIEPRLKRLENKNCVN